VIEWRYPNAGICAVDFFSQGYVAVQALDLGEWNEVHGVVIYGLLKSVGMGARVR